MGGIVSAARFVNLTALLLVAAADQPAGRSATDSSRLCNRAAVLLPPQPDTRTAVARSRKIASAAARSRTWRRIQDIVSQGVTRGETNEPAQVSSCLTCAGQ